MAYNLTGIVSGNETSLLTIVQGINTELMGGALGIILMIGIAFVFLSSFILITQSVKKSVAITSFICFSLSMTLVALDLMPLLALFLTLIISAISLAFTSKLD